MNINLSQISKVKSDMMAKMWRLIVVLSFFLTVVDVSAKSVSDYTSSVGENVIQHINPVVGSAALVNT